MQKRRLKINNWFVLTGYHCHAFTSFQNKLHSNVLYKQDTWLSLVRNCHYLQEIHFPRSVAKSPLWLHSFFYKNIVFPAEAECSYFFADFRLKIFLWIFLDYIAYDISAFECIWCLDGVKIILESACRHQGLVWRRNIISIEHTASAVFVAFFNSHNYIVFQISASCLFLRYS